MRGPKQQRIGGSGGVRGSIEPGVLRKLAGYVQEYGDNNLADILSTGFEVVSSNRAQHPLEAPTIKDIVNGNSGQLIPSVTPVQTARMYEGRYALAPAGAMQGPWISAGLFSNSRAMPINGLTPARTTSSNSAPSAAAPAPATGATRWGICACEGQFRSTKWKI
jgi:hypothetical protein